MDCIDAFCGNGMCEPGEMESCPTDCKLERYCGDGFCDDYEKEFCFADCEVEAECGDGICDFGEWDSCYSDCEVEEYCGDGYCSDEEDFMMCPIDCEPEGFCGDMFCDPGEEEWCPEDCGIEGFCGDGFCGFNENPGNCHDDCTFMEYFMEMETDKFFYQPGDTVEIIARIKDHEGNQPDHAMVRANVFFMGEFQIKETRIIKVDRTYEEEAVTTTATSAADLVSESNPQPAPAPSSSAVVATTATTAADTEYATAIGQAVAAAGGGYGGGAGTGGGYGMDKKGPGDVRGIGPGIEPEMYGPGMGGPGMGGPMGPGMGGPMGPGMGKDMMMGGPMMGPGGPMMLPPELQAQIGTSIQTRDGRTIKIQLEPGNERDPCPDNVCDGWELGAGDCPDDCKEVPGWSQSRGFGTGKEMMGPPGQGGFRGFENAGPGMGGPMGPDMMMRQGAHEMIRHEERGPRPEDSEDWKGDLYEKFPIQLDWNAEKQAYVGDFELEAGAKNGQYEIEVFALIDDRKMHHMMPFTVSEEGADAKDPFAFEQKGKSAAMKGEYQACVNDYIEAATLWVDQHHAQRVIVDVEKASTCIVLGDLDREEPYVKISEIVEDMAKKRGGPEKYIMMGTAAQYAELAGRHKEAKSMYRRAIKGLEREAEFVADFDPQGGVMLRLILGKYYEMVGQDDAAVKTYVEVAESIGDAFGQYGGPPEFIQALISAKLYEVAGEFEDAKFAYEEAADLIEFEEDVPGDAFGAVTTFMQGYCLEKAGNKEEAMDRYADAAELLDDIDMIDSEGIFFGSSAVGKSLERLGSPEEANDIFMSALKNLERRADQEGYYFASGISGYTGDFEKAKLYCKKELLRNLDADDIERMTFYSAYCYDVLGAGRKARAACNLAQTMPEAGESIMMRFVFEPFPTPASFCSKAMAVQPIERLETCGNDVLDPGETEDTCCSDVGCGSGYVCSNTLEKCVLPAKEIEPEKILKLILELEDIRMTFDGLASKALGISDFFAEKGNDERAGIWSGVADEFLGAGDKIDDIQRKIKDNRNALTEEILEDVRSDIRDLRDVINKAIDLILEAV